MIFKETLFKGVWLVEVAPHFDERGFFARTFCEDEFEAHGLATRFEQSSLSRNKQRGILRGLHFQRDPRAETKFVRCVRGAVFDVVVDLRDDSPTRGRWLGQTLTAESASALYIPPGVAHGFQALCDDVDVLYQITPSHKADHGAGVRWNDPRFAIEWPLGSPILSPRDASYADWDG